MLWDYWTQLFNQLRRFVRIYLSRFEFFIVSALEEVVARNGALSAIPSR